MYKLRYLTIAPPVQSFLFVYSHAKFPDFFKNPFFFNCLTRTQERVGHIGLGGRAGGRKEGKAVSGSSLRKFDGSSTYEIHL